MNSYGLNMDPVLMQQNAAVSRARQHAARSAEGSADKGFDKKLKQACIEMESLLVKQMLNSMRKAVPKTGLIDGGNAEEIFTDMLYDSYAMKISENQSLGLAKTMYNQLSGGKTW